MSKLRIDFSVDDLEDDESLVDLLDKAENALMDLGFSNIQGKVIDF